MGQTHFFTQYIILKKNLIAYKISKCKRSEYLKKKKKKENLVKNNKAFIITHSYKTTARRPIKKNDMKDRKNSKKETYLVVSSAFSKRPSIHNI